MSDSAPMLQQYNHIILIGLMGCGKTTIGRELQRTMDLPFFDTDQEIEEQEGVNITAIFQQFGEGYFRNLETRILRRYLSLPGENSFIISTGGGIIVREENRSLLRKLGFVVWLNADVSTLLQRVLRNDHRPLLHNAKPEETLARLFEERMPFYAESAHLSIDTNNLTIHEIAFGIMESARVFFNEKKTV